MNTAPPQPGPFQAPPPGGSTDPSMEDILASIRRILSEDEAEQPSAPHPEHEETSHAHDEPEAGVLALDSSMMVVEEPMAMPMMPVHVDPPAPPVYEPVAAERPPPASAATHSTHGALLGPEATAAAASSVGSLLRTLVAERQQVVVHRGGPTIEDLVREEIRPVLKEWLDSNLPPMVERLVRAEIERVVGRAIS